ncbi:hypothetical protein AB4Y44_42645, partial [Paraburkholderia sp. BR10937]|uniref:hypothetical protein n=1 Tax=Paraburkholderia sp. BR10937 TaxID=3236994 RepID=UPI0034D2C5F7
MKKDRRSENVLCRPSLGARYVTALCTTTESGEIAVAEPDPTELGTLIDDAPPMTGAEYLTPDVLAALWS